MHNDEWKDNRADISPAFTTMKTKLTYPIVDDRCKRLIEFIKAEIASGKPIMDTKLVYKLMYKMINSPFYFHSQNFI